MPEPGLDSRALRRALGLYTTGVTVITTRTQDGVHTGLTVNSFTSVSLDPPLVLFCLATRSSLLTAFEHAGHFAVNVLAKGQQALSNRFAKPSVNIWEDLKFRTGDCGCALLDGVLGTLECLTHAAYAGGDHLILIGEVIRFDTAPADEPLVFYQGSYGTFTRDQSGATAAPDSTLSDFVPYWG
jgi:flavin reductase (DIM6/NTAB) family NADH-FMN oxidoreductase RutF